MPTSAAPANIISLSAIAAPMRRATISSRAASIRRRMQTISYGKERPAVVGSNETAWAQNRRAVTVVPE